MFFGGDVSAQVFQDSGVVYLLDEAMAGYAVGEAQWNEGKTSVVEKSREIYGKSMGNRRKLGLVM